MLSKTRVGIDRVAVEEARRAGRIFAIPIIRRTERYPDLQLDASGAPLDGLSGIIAMLGPGWPTCRFLMRVGENGLTNHARLAVGEISGLMREARVECSGNFGLQSGGLRRSASVEASIALVSRFV